MTADPLPQIRPATEDDHEACASSAAIPVALTTGTCTTSGSNPGARAAASVPP